MAAIQIADLDNGKVDVDHVAKFANSTELTAVDRMGRTKRTLAGIDAEAESRMDSNDAQAESRLIANDAAAVAQRVDIQGYAEVLLGSLGYLVPVPYAAGLEMTAPNQTVLQAGNAYAPIESELPFTTSGVFEEAKFRLIQGISAADLALPGAASIIADAVRRVDSISELRSLPVPTRKTAVVCDGYHLPGDRGGGDFVWIATSTKVDDGGSVIMPLSAPAVGRWERREFVSVYDFGAKGDNIADDTAAIQAAFTYVRLSERPGCVDFRTGGIFRINKPIKGTYNIEVRGSATILAVEPFSTVTFDIQGGGTLVAAPMFYFVDGAPTTPGHAGTIGSFSGSRRFGLEISKSIILNADDVAGFGIFLDNYFDYRIHSRIIDPTKWGVWHYSNGWGGEIHSYITGPGEGGVWLGGACNGINLDHLKVWGDNKIPTIAGLLIDGDNNGLSTKGTFIEKVTKGVICRNGCGPMDFSGIDFEKIEQENVVVDNSAIPSRIGGPVTVQGCFLETISPTHALVRATNAIVITRGNRMRNAAKAFEHTGNGHILDESNMMQSTVLSVGTGRVISKGVKSTRNWAETSYSGASQTLEVVREFSNNAYANNPALSASGLQFWHAITDVGTQRMIGRADLFVCDMQGGAEIGRAGLRVNYTGGGAAKQLTPLDDNATSAGSATNRYSVVHAGSGSISTSDEREKQDIESILDAVLDAWAEVEFRQYRWQHAVADKGGEARIHFGFIAQQIKSAFETHGVDGTRFGLLCHDAWGDEYEVDRNADGTAKLKVNENGDPIPRLDGEGRPTGEFEVELTLVRSAGDRWGVRIDECLLLEAALMRRELARLSARVTALEGST